MKAKKLACFLMEYPEAEVLVIDYRRRKWDKNLWVRYNDDPGFEGKRCILIAFEKEKNEKE